MAEHLLRKRLAEAGVKNIHVASAGVAAETGYGATSDAQRALEEYGIEDITHTAQPMTQKLVDWADLILAMDSGHKQRVIDRFPEAAGKTHVLNTYAGTGTDRDGILDPYGYPLPTYKKVLAEIENAIGKILKKI